MNAPPLIWVHADALSLTHPVFQAAPADARPVCVWDADDVARRGWSLKRCLFVLDCLAEMGVPVIEGRAETVLAGQEIYTAASADPHIRSIIAALEPRVMTIADTPFAMLPKNADMGRFFRFWNKVRRSAMQPTSQMDVTIQGDGH